MARGIKRPIPDKLNAALAYLITGETEGAAKLCGIPGRTIREWTEEPWWADVITEARKMKNDELDAAFTSILHKATGEVADRIEHGDEIIQKDGSKARRKVSARDATLVAAVLIDKRAVLRGEPTRISKSINEKERLNTLKNNLEGLAGFKEEEKEKDKEDKPLH